MHCSTPLNILALFTLLAVCAVSPGRIAATPEPVVVQEHADSAAALIGYLDDCIQQRFLDVDQGFGYRRIVRPGDTPHRFKPENAKELAVEGHLRRHKLDVVLYLAGRGIIAPDLNSKEVDAIADKLIKGPVRITATDKQRIQLPSNKQLFNHGQEAMRVFERSDNYEFNLGQWKFIARPVRASDQSCLKCHQHAGISYLTTADRPQAPTSLQVGDPLGVLVYGYKNSDQ